MSSHPAIPLCLISLFALGVPACASGPAAQWEPSDTERCARGSWVDRLEGEWAFLGGPALEISMVTRAALPAQSREGDVIIDGRVDELCTRAWREEIRGRRAHLSSEEARSTRELRL